MHCLFCVDYFQRHERHSPRYPQIRQTPQGGRVTEQQAEALADAKELEVALRNEIKQLDVTLRGEIKQLDVKIEQIRSDLARDLKDLEYRMTIKLGTMMVVAVAAMAT